MTPQTRLQQALKAHQQGHLEQARSVYLEILGQHPRNSDALHLLGVCEFQSGHADAAIRHLNAAIALAPETAEYHNNLGEVLRHSARLDEAEKAYRKSLQLAPDYADAHNNLALVLQGRGDLTAAIAHLRKAMTLDPEAPQNAANLGSALRLAGDYTGAEESYRQALALAPAFAEARLALCQLLLEQEQITQAASLAEAGVSINARDPAALSACATVAVAQAGYAKAGELLAATAKLNPQSVPVQMALGGLLLQLGQSHEALRWLQLAARQSPDTAQLQYTLSQACLELNDLDQAHAAILKARQLDPDNLDFMIQLARICRYRDLPDEAIQSLQAVLASEPDNLPATLELAEVRLLTGDTDGALDLLQRALTREPGNHTLRERLASVLISAGKANSSLELLTGILARNPERITSYCLLSQAKRFNLQDAAVLEDLSGLLASRDLSPPLATAGHFALGKMLADCGRYEQAFEHFQQANQLHRKQIHYDARAHESFVQEQIEAFDRPRMERLAAYGNTSRVPIIIAGMPRSGTTLTERILASHPQVAASGEINVLTRMNPKPVGGAATAHYLGLALDTLNEATVQRLARDYLSRLGRGHPQVPHITDKTPQNFLHLGMAAILFPQAPIIHCDRHPLATCLSIYSMEMNLGNEFAYRLEELAHYYGQYRQIMHHWRELLPGRIYNLSYERLVTDFEKVCRELLAFCDLQWDPRCLDFHTSAGTVLTASDWQVRQPLYTGALDAWRHYQVQLEPLRRALETNGVALD